MTWLLGEVNYYAEKTAAPEVTDDMNKGYVVSDIWIDETNDVAYQCLDNTTGAAVWSEMSLSSNDHVQGTDTALGTQAEALDMGNFNINNLANAVDIHDAATLEDVLNAANIVLNYWIQATSTLGLVYSNTPASGTELVTTGVTELTSADTFFKSSVADTTTPFEILAGGIILAHIQAEVDATLGYRDAALHAELYYVDSGGTLNPVQIGADSNSTGTLTTTKAGYELHIHVTSEVTVPTGKRLWLKLFATVTGSGNDPTVEIYNGDSPDHISIPVAGSVLGNFLQLSGGTMSGDIAMGTNKLTGLKVPNTAGDSIRATAKITEALLESATDHLTGTEHAELNAWLDDVVLADGGAITTTQVATFAQLVLTPRADALSAVQGGIFFDSDDTSVYVCTEGA